MMNWIITGALAAVFMAELFDAWALRRLFSRCQTLSSSGQGNPSLLRWYADGFQHSVVMSTWLGGSALLLAVLAVCAQAHPVLIIAGLLLAVTAHMERELGQSMRRKFLLVTAEN